MTTAAELLTPERVRCKEPISSKKRALEVGASLLASALPSMSHVDVFEALNSRERLGSTGLGHGVALPHGRVERLEAPIGACLTLAEPVDFDAPDRQRVDILYLLLVPRECSTEHLRILAELASLFNDAGLRDALRRLEDSQAVLDSLRDWSPAADGRARGTA